MGPLPAAVGNLGPLPAAVENLGPLHTPLCAPLLVRRGEVGPAAVTRDQGCCPHSLECFCGQSQDYSPAVFSSASDPLGLVEGQLGPVPQPADAAIAHTPSIVFAWLALCIFNGILYCFSCTAPGHFAVHIFVDGCNESIANNNLGLEGTEFAKQLTIHTCCKHGEKSPA